MDDYDAMEGLAELEVSQLAEYALRQADEEESEGLGSLGVGMEPPSILHHSSSGRFGAYDERYWVNRWRAMHGAVNAKLRKAEKRIADLERRLGVEAGG